MPKAKLHFRGVHQTSQDLGGNDEHMISRVYFDLEIAGALHKDLYADVKQAVGSTFSAENIEVMRPTGYQGPFNQAAFAQLASRYFCSLVGPTGSAFGMGGGHFRDNLLGMDVTEEFDYTAENSTW